MSAWVSDQVKCPHEPGSYIKCNTNFTILNFFFVIIKIEEIISFNRNLFNSLPDTAIPVSLPRMLESREKIDERQSNQKFTRCKILETCFIHLKLYENIT